MSAPATHQPAPAQVPATKPKPGYERPEQPVNYHRIRITLSSRNVKSLEKGWATQSFTFIFYFLLRRKRCAPAWFF